MDITQGAETVALPDDLYWSDELNWVPVEQAVQRTLTGALIVSAAALQAGRPITLEPIDDQSAWMTRDTVDQLRNWATVAGLQMQITLRGTPRTVVFRHHDGAAIEAHPVAHFSDVVDGDFYLVTIRLMEI